MNMKRRYGNLNEEMNRIKSLFTEERLYGNLRENKLLTEQGIGRRLADALETASSSVAKAIKNVDPKLATNFLNSEINTFGDLAKHLNEYKSLWKSMGIDWDYANDAVLSFKKWSDSGFLKTADDKLILQVINDLPAEGDLRGMVFDLWKESKGKYTPAKTNPKTTIVTKSNTGENVVHKVETVGGKEKIETYRIEGDTIKKDDTYDTNNASKEVNDHYDGVDGGSSAGSTRVTTDEINANGNPDNIKGEIITAIEEGFKQLGNKSGKEMGVDQVIKEIDGGKVLMIKTSDGKIKIINTVEMVELTLDESGNIISQKSLKPIDTTPTKSPVRDEGGNIVEPTDSDSPITQGTVVDNTTGSKSNFGSKIAGTIGQGFRWTFPTISQSLKFISLLGPGRKFYSKQRFSFVDLAIPSKGDYSDVIKSGLKIAPELPARIVAEQIALITLYTTYKTIERGGLPKDESITTTALADYWNSNIWKFHPINLIPSALVWWYEDVADLRKDAYSGCRAKCEKKMSAAEVTNSECFKECKGKVDSLFSKIDKFKEDLKEFQTEYVTLSNIKEWNQQEIEDFCNDRGGKATKIKERISNLKKSLTDLDGEVKTTFESGKLKDRQWVLYFTDLFGKVIPGIPNLPTYDEMMEKLLPKSQVDGQPLNLQKIQELENKLNTACSEYWNKKREVDAGSEGGVIVDPDDFDGDVDTNKVIDQNELDNMFGKIEVSIEPIEIV